MVPSVCVCVCMKNGCLAGGGRSKKKKKDRVCLRGRPFIRRWSYAVHKRPRLRISMLLSLLLLLLRIALVFYPFFLYITRYLLFFYYNTRCVHLSFFGRLSQSVFRRTCFYQDQPTAVSGGGLQAVKLLASPACHARSMGTAGRAPRYFFCSASPEGRRHQSCICSDRWTKSAVAKNHGMSVPSHLPRRNACLTRISGDWISTKTPRHRSPGGSGCKKAKAC